MLLRRNQRSNLLNNLHSNTSNKLVTTEGNDFVTTGDRNLISPDNNDEHISCPVCACAMTDNEELHVCETCDTPHHKDCWEYTGGCAIFGCRKGALRKFEDRNRQNYHLTTINMGLMKVWGKLLYADLALFLLGHYSTLAMFLTGYFLIYLSIIMKVVSIVSGIPLGYKLSFILWKLFALFPLVPLAAIGVYVLIFIPKMIMRFHLWIYNIPVSGKKMDTAMKVAKRVELPQHLVNLGNYMYSKGRQITLTGVKIYGVTLTTLIIVGTCALLLKSYPIGFILPTIFAMTFFSILFVGFLHLIYSNGIPGTLLEMENRLRVITSFQNRIIASAKKSKR